MRILVTGSMGTLGRVLWRELELRGYEVFGCDLKHSENPNELRADVGDARQVARTFEMSRPDVVYHLAAEFGRNNGEEYPEQLWRSNCLGTRNVIDACIKHKARLIFASSSEAYGDLAANTPAGLEESSLDTQAPAFHNEYALTKWANERQICTAANNRGLNAMILRFFNAYGPGEFYTPYRSVVCLFAYRLMLGLPITVYKNYHRVFMYVDDWARTVANAAQVSFKNPATCAASAKFRPDLLFRVPVYNIGGEEYRSVEELKDKIVKLLGGSSSQITYMSKEAANITNKKPDIRLAQADLQHDPKITLDEGLPPTLAWMSEHISVRPKEQTRTGTFAQFEQAISR